jgi:hypothetical protein
MRGRISMKRQELLSHLEVSIATSVEEGTPRCQRHTVQLPFAVPAPYYQIRKFAIVEGGSCCGPRVGREEFVGLDLQHTLLCIRHGLALSPVRCRRTSHYATPD